MMTALEFPSRRMGRSARSNFRTIILGSVLLLAHILAPSLLDAQDVAANAKDADFAALSRYRDDDLNLIQAKTPVRVVFLGDSITEYWGSHAGTWFNHPGWTNRGIGGQTTSQLLLRERQDVLDLKPQAVVLEGASNDMRLGYSAAEIRDNLASMGELAEAHHIRVYLVEMTPVCDCFRPLAGLRSVSRIQELNRLLLALSRQKHWPILPFHDALADPNGAMRTELTVDGVHPNDAGYAVLAPLVESALKAYR
jgi:lysophospholipase L1-like esterase